MKNFLLLLIYAVLANIALGQEIKKVKVTEVQDIMANSKGPLVINFWATFCKPCIEEIPHFQKFAEKYKKDGLQVIFISLDMQDDFPKKVNAFIRKRKMSTWWLDETNADYFCPRVDSAWSGAIPATLFINNKSGYRKFSEESISEPDLEKEILTTLGRSD